MSLLGLRVLRGPDWRGGDTDGGEGHVGTVIELLGDHTMRVLWDMGQESTCSAGHDGKCELRVFDTAQIGVRHPDTRCSDCGESDIWGMLWRCRDCTGCDLCPPCYSNDRHDLRHQFVRIDTPESKGQLISKRKTSVKNRSLGLFPGSKVTRGKDWQWGDQDGGQGSEGEVKGYENASPDSVRNLVRVEWPGGDVKTYRHGFYGYVDVTCAEEEEGPYYYRDHLPVLNTDQVQSLSAAVDTEPRNSDSPPTADDREEEVPGSGPTGEHASNLTVTECLSASIESTLKESRISTEGVSSLSISSARSHRDDAETTCAVTEVGTPTSKSESDSEREVQVLKAGDKVRLKEDQQELKAVNCRVGWKEGMEKTAGKVGQVLTVDSEGDLLVSFGRHHFLFAPACCTHVTSDTPVDSLRLDTRPAPGGVRKTETSGNTAGDLRLDTRPAMSGERKTETSGNTAGDLRLDTRPAMSGERKTETSGNTAGDKEEEPKAMFKKLREAVINEKSGPKVESIPGDSSFLFSADPGLLLSAVQSGDYETVRQLCLADTSLIELEIQRLTPLILACNRGHRQVVRVLLDCGADVNHCIPPHRTTIGAALERSHEDIVELMLEQGADPFSLDNKGHTFLHIAAWHNLPRAITALAARGVDVNALDDVHDTALHLAIVKHHHEAVEALMAIPGVNLTVPNINGYPMMHHAASKGNSRAIELMLEKDRSQVHALLQGATPLHTAVHNDYDDCVRVLVLNGGADVNFKDTVSSDTPLTLACIRGMYRAAEALLELGADIQTQNHNGHTPLHLVIGGHRSKDKYGPEGQQENQVRVALASLLVSNGALVDAPDLAGRDPFSYGLAAIREGVRAFMKQNPRLVRRKGPTEGTIFGAGQLTTGKGRGQLADDLRGVGLPCGVCGASKSDVTLQPCQHKCVCSTCSVKVTRCPLCDEKVTDKLVTGAEPPSRPQGPIKVLSTTKTSATIEWRAPEDDGGLPLSAYVLEKREFPRSTWSRVDKISPDMTSNTIQNLTTGSDYFFRVMAENKAGPSPPLEMDKPVRIKSPYDVPSAPTGLRVSNVTDKSADVSWTAPDSDGGTPITNYIVQTRIIPRSTFTTVQETTETKVTLTGLVADSQYMLQIIAVNAEGQSLPLQSREPICPEKILSVPDAPASLLIKNITKDGLTLEWTPPENDGGSRVRRYIIEKSLKGTDKWEKVTTVESFRTRCTVADLEREKDYFFAVSAENDVGIGEKQKTAKPVKMEKPIFPPSPPTGPLVISDVTKTSFKVTWKTPEKDGGSPVTHYSVEKRETWKTSWTLVERVPGDRLTCDLLLLQEGQDLVGVKAENVAGESKPLESEHAITPMSPYKKPSAPESLTATDVTETAVSLKWKPPTSDGGLPIKSYIVERRDKHWGSWVKAGTTKGTVTTLDVDGLVTGQEYYFRVSAENEEGVGPETEMKELVKPTREAVVPEPPTGPVYFSHLDATSVVLDWRAPRDDGGAPVLNYRIEVSQNQETWTEVTIVDGDLTKTKAKNLATDKKHNFRIFAINKVGTSKPLESDAVTPKRPVGPPGKPVGPLEAKAITRDSVQLDWKPPQDDGGLPITGYIIEKREAMRMTWSRADKTTDDEDTGGTCHWR